MIVSTKLAQFLYKFMTKGISIYPYTQLSFWNCYFCFILLYLITWRKKNQSSRFFNLSTSTDIAKLANYSVKMRAKRKYHDFYGKSPFLRQVNDFTKKVMYMYLLRDDFTEKFVAALLKSLKTAVNWFHRKFLLFKNQFYFLTKISWKQRLYEIISRKKNFDERIFRVSTLHAMWIVCTYYIAYFSQYFRQKMLKKQAM